MNKNNQRKGAYINTLTKKGKVTLIYISFVVICLFSSSIYAQQNSNSKINLTNHHQSTSQDAQWYFIAPVDNLKYRKFFNIINQQFSKHKINFLTTIDIQNCTFPVKKIKLITAGISPLKQLKKCKVTVPVFAFYLTEYQYQQLNIEQSHSLSQANIFFADQPLINQVALSTQLLPEKNEIGLMYTKSLKQQVFNLEKILPKNFTLHKREIDVHKKFILKFVSLIKSSNFLIAPFDGKLYNSINAKIILMTSYRHEKPIIGNSKGFVRAGIVASCYSTPEILLKQLVDTLKKHPEIRSQKYYANDFEIILNSEVAHSFNMDIISTRNLKERVINQLNKWEQQ